VKSVEPQPKGSMGRSKRAIYGIVKTRRIAQFVQIPLRLRSGQALRFARAVC